MGRNRYTGHADFRFFAIDTDIVVSGKNVLELGEDGTYKASNNSLTDVLRWFTWFMVAIKSVSSRSSTEELAFSELFVKRSIIR